MQVREIVADRCADETTRRLEDGQTRVHYVPWAKFIAYAGYGKKQIHVRKYDFETRLKESGEGYLFVESLSPLIALKGERLTHDIHCKTNSDSLSFKLVEGPEGMRAGCIQSPYSRKAKSPVATLKHQSEGR